MTLVESWLVNSATFSVFWAFKLVIAGSAVGTGSPIATGLERNGISFSIAFCFASKASMKYLAAQLGNASWMYPPHTGCDPAIPPVTPAYYHLLFGHS